ncbi:Hypothetical protein YALI2_F00267g [Yarrowia lipolytica]|nr:Hypothetical protein YALI2_F00267g [Yarrowia lipolytica]
MDYHELLQLKASKSAKKGGKETLAELDEWRKQLSDDVRENPRALTHGELAKLMTWKLKRGTFRPKLQQLAESNRAEEVEQVTQKAAHLIAGDEIIEAIKVLSELKGVGPATASLLGSVMSVNVPFFSDEAFAHVCPGVKITYTLKAYEKFLNAIVAWGQQRDLNAVEAEQEAWVLGMRDKYADKGTNKTGKKEQEDVKIVKTNEEEKEEKEEERPAKRRRR